MATRDATKDAAYNADIQRLQQANALMRSANQALAEGMMFSCRSWVSVPRTLPNCGSGAVSELPRSGRTRG